MKDDSTGSQAQVFIGVELRSSPAILFIPINRNPLSEHESMSLFSFNMFDNLHVIGESVTKDEFIVGDQRLEGVCLFDLKFACLSFLHVRSKKLHVYNV